MDGFCLRLLGGSKLVVVGLNWLVAFSFDSCCWGLFEFWVLFVVFVVRSGGGGFCLWCVVVVVGLVWGVLVATQCYFWVEFWVWIRGFGGGWCDWIAWQWYIIFGLSFGCCCVVWFVSKEEIKTVEERESVGEDEREMINKWIVLKNKKWNVWCVIKWYIKIDKIIF